MRDVRAGIKRLEVTTALGQGVLTGLAGTPVFSFSFCFENVLFHITKSQRGPDYVLLTLSVTTYDISQ